MWSRMLSFVTVLFAYYVFFISQASKKLFFKLISSKPLDENAVSLSMDKVTLSTQNINKGVDYRVIPGSAVFEG